MPKNDQEDGCVKVEPLHLTEDSYAFVSMLVGSGISILGMNESRIFKALVGDALLARRTGPVFVAAKAKGGYIGFLLCIINRTSYFRIYAARHPFVAILYLIKRLHMTLRQRTSSTIESSVMHEYANTTYTHAHEIWEEESDMIAKVQYIYVHPQYRGLNVAGMMYASMKEEMISRGVKRMDAMVDHDNEPSMALHERVFKEYHGGNGCNIYTMQV